MGPGHMLQVIVASPTSDLTVLEVVKEDLKISDAASDSYLAKLIKQASDICTRYCNRTTFGRETLRQIERLTKSEPSILLARDLNISITSVSVDGVALAASDYELDGTLLYRLVNDQRKDWDSGSKVVIEFLSGYTLLNDLPYDVERACLDLIQRMYGKWGRDPMLRSERLLNVVEKDYAIGRSGEQELPTEISDRLNPYRLWVIA